MAEENTKPTGAGAPAAKLPESNQPTAHSPLPTAIAPSDREKRYRHARAEEKDFTDDNTVQVALSSEFPVETRAGEEEERLGIATRGEKYLEILSHDEGDVDLSRLNDSGAFLDEHKDNRHLGKIRKAVLSTDKVTRVLFEFDNASKLSKTRRKQMRSGSRPHVSLGYTHTAYRGAVALPDGRTGHRFAWLGLEGSSVAVPADPTVGKGRAADEECRCMRCGGLFSRDLLDDDYMCEDCADAEDPDGDGDEAGGRNLKSKHSTANIQHSTSKNTEDRGYARADTIKFVEEKLRAVDLGRKFRAKMGDEEEEISMNDLRQFVGNAADSDKRFKYKSENGNVYSDFYVYDIVQSGAEWKAIIVGPEYKMYEVDFEFDGEAVTLGEAVEVEAVTEYQPVERGQKAESAMHRHMDLPAGSRQHVAGVDSGGVSEAKKQRTNDFMPKTVAELSTEAPEAVSQIRTDTERNVRASITAENEKNATKIKARNDEIHALADEFVKKYGMRHNGKPGEVYVVGERLRALERETCEAGADKEISELRQDFKRSADLFIQGSREPKNPVEAANLPNELASRCSLGRILREGIKSADKNQRSSCFMITDGAEYEAHQEIHKNALEFPGGAANLAEGVQLPWNMPSGVRSSTPVGRLKRDALAGDFATAGALIAPEYIFPTIELLRNFPALARAGMTILSGVQGPLVLPRQESATTAQSVAEGGALAQYDQVLGQIKMAPHRVGTSQKYSRLALLQSTPDFEAMVMADHMAQMALKIDYLGLNGQGAGDEPLGILNQMIPVVVFGGSAANTYKNAVALETAVRKTNIYEGGSYITTSTARGMLKSVARLLVGATTVAAVPVWENGDTVNGRPAWDSQQVPGDVLVFGVFRHLVMAQWGGLAVVLDTISQANQDKYWLNINTYVDFALRHNSAISKSADSLASLT